MDKAKQILIDFLNGKSVSRWDCAIHKKEIRAELRSLENKFETEIDLARESY